MTDDNRPIVHLICNAHIDPVWMWSWEEGLREAISTFHTAAQLLDDFPEFVFNHNESLLYEWIEEYDPALFEQIKQHVSTGRWNITGGWYLQPDCNMPAGETMIRLMLEGRRYFQQRFGVRPPVAYNFDSFGHPESFPQLLQGAGFEFYIHFRPTASQMELPAPLYRWRGRDGSSIVALRPDTGWYGTPGPGQEREQALRGIHIARETGRDTLVTWGLGDHGGGATRADLEMFRELFEEYADSDIILRHSTPEAYLERMRPHLDSLPVVEGDLQRTLAGTYTSVALIKRRMRQGESLLSRAERWSAINWWLNDAPYPAEDLHRAWKDLMFNTFHDILCGSLVEHAIPGVDDIYGSVHHTARRLLTRAQLALLPDVPPQPDTIPLYVFNPHPVRVQSPAGLHFLSEYAPPPSKKAFSLYDDNGDPVTCQTSGGPSIILEKGTWQPFVGFIADVPPLSARRYEIRFEDPVIPPAAPLDITQTQTHITIETSRWRAIFSQASGALTNLHLKDGNRSLLTDPAQFYAMRDVAHGWGGEDRAVFNEPVSAFRALSPPEVGTFTGMDGESGQPVRVIARGDVWITVECLVIWQHTRAAVRYTFYADLPYIDIHTRLHMQARRKMIKFQLPFALPDCTATCEIPGGITQRPTDATEYPYNRYLRLDNANLSIGLANDGQYGFDVDTNGRLNLSISRGGVHSSWEEDGIPVQQSYTFMDQTQIDTAFRLLAETDPAKLTAQLALAALTLNEKPDCFYSYFPPTLPVSSPQKSEPFLTVDVPTVLVSTIKRAEQVEQTEEDDDALIIRLIEVAGEATRAQVTLTQQPPQSIDFNPYEIKTFKVQRSGTWMPVNLIEEA